MIKRRGRDIEEYKDNTAREMEVLMCVFFWHRERKAWEERTCHKGKMLRERGTREDI